MLGFHSAWHIDRMGALNFALHFIQAYNVGLGKIARKRQIGNASMQLCVL
jgi:hypothetical protein